MTMETRILTGERPVMVEIVHGYDEVEDALHELADLVNDDDRQLLLTAHVSQHAGDDDLLVLTAVFH